MMKPSRTVLIFVLLGCALVLLGVTFKLNHLMGAEIAFNGGVALWVVGLLAWVVQLLRRR